MFSVMPRFVALAKAVAAVAVVMAGVNAHAQTLIWTMISTGGRVTDNGSIVTILPDQPARLTVPAPS